MEITKVFYKIDEEKPLGAIPSLAQEFYLIEDILFVMMSIDGVYIKRKQDPQNKGRYKYFIEPQLEAPTSGNLLLNIRFSKAFTFN